MDKQQMLNEVRAEIERLKQMEALLVAGGADSFVPPPTTRRTRRTFMRDRAPRRQRAAQRAIGRRAVTKTVTGRMRRPMSAEDRQKRSDAQKARWERVRRLQKEGSKAETSTPTELQKAV